MSRLNSSLTIPNPSAIYLALNNPTQTTKEKREEQFTIMITKLVEFDLESLNDTARLELGKGNYIDVARIKTVAMNETYISMTCGDKTAVGQNEMEVSTYVHWRAVAYVRIVGWKLVSKGQEIHFEKAAILSLPQELIEHVAKFVTELDNGFAGSETGTDNPED